MKVSPLSVIPARHVSRLLFVLPLLFFNQSCSYLIRDARPGNAFVWWSDNDTAPKTVVVLPFENSTGKQGIEETVRKSFYNHLSSKNYLDFELRRVDEALKTIDNSYSKGWKELKKTDLGRYFHADYLISGRVACFRKVFLGIYAQIELNVELTMVEGTTGRKMLTASIVKQSHDGGFPFSPFGLLPAALRSGIHMSESRTIDLVERICRELALEIPDPPMPPVSLIMLEIQVASFLDEQRALNTLRTFQTRGFTGRIEKVHLGDTLWHRILFGPYYDKTEAEKIMNALSGEAQFKPMLIHHYPVKPSSSS